MSLRLVVPTLRDWIWERKGQIDLALAPFGMQLREVYAYERETIDVGMFPCLTLGTQRNERAWVSLPSTIEERVEIECSGYILHDDTEENDRAIKAFADEFALLFEREYLNDIEIPGQTYRIHYHSEVPGVIEYETGYEAMPDAFCRVFTARWVGYVTRGLGQS